jgi:hypothetical protein
MPTLTLEQEQYEALIALARAGASTPDEARNLDYFLQQIETANNIRRYRLWVQWQEADQPLPPTTQFPYKWPPEMRHYIELLTRPITKEDVQAVLKAKARKPVGVLVTPDVGGVLGWTKPEDYFIR